MQAATIANGTNQKHTKAPSMETLCRQNTGVSDISSTAMSYAFELTGIECMCKNGINPLEPRPARAG